MENGFEWRSDKDFGMEKSLLLAKRIVNNVKSSRLILCGNNNNNSSLSHAFVDICIHCSWPFLILLCMPINKIGCEAKKQKKRKILDTFIDVDLNKHTQNKCDEKKKKIADRAKKCGKY